tara:strand:+ start:909 stop:1253 length:345 start_codon:yes stop_codon:yes gene_type:complete
MIQDNNKETFFFISLGAIPGALLRWQIDEIFIVNIIGCFLLGFFNALGIPKRFKLTLVIGLCGSMTTFSGWSLELYNLISQGLYKLFLFNITTFVITGVGAICLGHIFAKKLNP